MFIPDVTSRDRPARQMSVTTAETAPMKLRIGDIYSITTFDEAVRVSDNGNAATANSYPIPAGKVVFFEARGTSLGRS